jgi:hypothetical protein
VAWAVWVVWEAWVDSQASISNRWVEIHLDSNRIIRKVREQNDKPYIQPFI